MPSRRIRRPAAQPVQRRLHPLRRQRHLTHVRGGETWDDRGLRQGIRGLWLAIASPLVPTAAIPTLFNATLVATLTRASHNQPIELSSYLVLRRCVLGQQSSEHHRERTVNVNDDVEKLARALARALKEDDPSGYVGIDPFGRVALDGTYDLVKIAQTVACGGLLVCACLSERALSTMGLKAANVVSLAIARTRRVFSSTRIA